MPEHLTVKLEPLGEEHLEALLPMIGEYHAFDGVEMPPAARREAVRGLLTDPRLGAVWAIVAQGAWIGYAAVTYGYSIEFGGRDAFIDELFLRESHRGRGIGTEVLAQLEACAREAGISALHLEVDRHNPIARALYAKLGFELREKFSLMSLKL